MAGLKIAICIDIPEFHANQITDGSWCSRFPGALWMYALFALAKSHGSEVVSGDLALTHVLSGYWAAKDVYVIQELNAGHGRELIKLGARPFVLTGFESPLYAYKFYDGLPLSAALFPYRVLFGGAFGLFHAATGNNIQLTFPNFDDRDVPPLVAWEDRKPIVVVAANKYWKEPFRIPRFHNLRRYLGWLLSLWRKAASSSRKIAIDAQLHDKRLEAIEYFGQRGMLSVFGGGWQELSRLPVRWRHRLSELLASLNIVQCEDKTATMAGYRFALCFENIAYPGYVTEKIIDCFVAGVIPIYLGAPDIENHIPKGAFIDARKFESLSDLESYLSKIDNDSAFRIISEGRAFLNSKRGESHSYQGFARLIWEMFETEQAK